MFKANDMRRLIRLIEDVQMNPKLMKYITMYPEMVANDPQELLDSLKQETMESRSRFAWAIAQLPDGRYIRMFPKFAQELGLQIVQQGDSTEFMD